MFNRKNKYGRILPSSVLARHHFIDIGGGVIDSDFRSKLTVIMFNHSNKPYKVKVGDRITQLFSIVMTFQALLCVMNYKKLMEDWEDLVLQAIKICIFLKSFIVYMRHKILMTWTRNTLLIWTNVFNVRVKTPMEATGCTSMSASIVIKI